VSDDGWNPLFVLYARAHGRTPAEQRAHDRATYPGAAGMPYMQWNTLQLNDWRAEESAAGRPTNPVRHTDYERWLSARVDTLQGGAA